MASAIPRAASVAAGLAASALTLTAVASGVSTASAALSRMLVQT